MDTAQDYGESEKIIGSSKYMNKTFEIITKVKKIDLKRHGQDELVDMLNETLGMSLKNLRRDKLEGLLIHDPEMLRGNKGNKVINWLKEQKKSGKVKKIGVSIYETKDIADKHMEWIDIIQAPYSIYDQRIMLESNRLKEGIKRRN